MIRALSCCAALLAAGPLAALSCLPVDVATSYQWADEAEEGYIVLIGAFSFDARGRAVPRPSDINDPTPLPAVAASFEGRALAEDGFTRPYSGTVTLTPVCWGPWCGGYPAPGPALAFVEVREGALTLELGPCGGAHFAGPLPGAAERVEACHRGAGCEAETLR